MDDQSDVRGDYERLQKLQAVADAALSSLDLDDLLDVLLERLKDVFEADTCVVLLIEDGALVPRAARGLEEEVGAGIRIGLGEGFAGRVAAERKTVRVDDVRQANVVNPILHEKGIRVLLGTPLLAQDQVLGVLHVGRFAERPFTADDVTLIELAADRVARALERAIVHDELVRLDQLKRDFIAVASHELRTPATSVRGLASTLHHRYGTLSAEQERTLLQTLYEQSERLTTLLVQLLDLSRLDAGVIDVQPKQVRVRDQLQQIVATAAAEQIDAVELKVPEELEAFVDPSALDHIVGNLIVNALRYGAAPVEIHALQLDRHFRLIVEDHGEGIDPAFVPHLFDRFSRDRDPGDNHRGAGLGLSIARAYAKAHGGELLYQPALPQGTRFELVLPRQHPDPSHGSVPIKSGSA